MPEITTICCTVLSF